jgi:hypothetical protein
MVERNDEEEKARELLALRDRILAGEENSTSGSKRKEAWLMGGGAVILLAFLIGAIASETPKPESAGNKANQSTDEPRATGEKCFSVWDGSNKALVENVKGALREPDSFEHIKTNAYYTDDKSRLSVKMSYRARNGFGGMNVEAASASVDVESCALADVEIGQAP